MTNPTPHGQVPAIQRYKIGYHADEWGVRSSTPSGIPDASGSWVRYEDHAAELRRLHAENERLAALVEAQQPAPSAAAAVEAEREGLRVAIRSAIQASRYHFVDPIRRDTADRVLLDLLDDLNARTAAPQPSPTPSANSVLEDADPIRALIAEHAAILDQNESAYFELCYHRATGWMAWITDKPLCMPPVVNPDRKVLAQGQGDTADEACRDAASQPASKQGANHD